ncbi:MAG TPA: PH domain-containing protein [Candidatus Eisenbacteria bacterium]|jgi:putative membrane protein|nr:PH domain-containing protein [Candidatus Eisenbacteria bacterium]
MHRPIDEAAIFAIQHPNSKLMVYYFLRCLLSGPFFPILIIPHYFKYHTLRYRFDAEGISMRWGILFRREIILNYSRIQDIHLSSNVVERWLGLARIQVQTASSSAGAEMTIEGLLEYEMIRDFLYSKMRGMKEKSRQSEHTATVSNATLGAVLDLHTAEALTVALREVSSELRAIRLALEQKKP